MKIGDLVQNLFRQETMVGIVMAVNHMPLIGPITGRLEPEVHVMWCPIGEWDYYMYRLEDLEVINEDR